MRGALQGAYCRKGTINPQGGASLSGWPDRQVHQANQIDQTDQRNQMNKRDERDALAGEEAFEEGGRDVALLEVGVVEDALVQRDGCLDAFDHKFVKDSAHAGDGFLPVPPMGDDFGDHGIVERDDHHIRFYG